VVAHHHHGHDHAHEHGHAHASRRALSIALGLIAALFAAEVVFGLVAGSLALLADAGHMLTDVLALAVALAAATVAGRPAQGRWTFGFGRVEVLAAQVNGVTLAIVGVWIVYAAIRRLFDPPDVRGGVVLAVALAGVAVNVVAAAVLARSARDSLNVRGAFLHLLTDLAAFAGTAVAGLLVLVTGWDRFDPVASLVVAGLIFWSAWQLLHATTLIFLDLSPGGIDPGEVGRAIAAFPAVVEAHDLHVWSVSDGFPALSAHVLVQPNADCHGIRRELETMLGERFGITHTTLQVDHAARGGLIHLRPRRRRGV
jgi:cobalt-zinc-cadmium efflux system protein